MDFISNSFCQIEEMLQEIGIGSIQDLFADIPEKLRCKAISTDDGLSEYEGMKLMERIGAKNTYPYMECYLGAGAYQHHIPALVAAICGKSEFLTAYTPYQPEVSQGMLQIIFEFQSAICAMTGMDAANASLYDGASACAEALLMALRSNKQSQRILIAKSLHPHYRRVVDLYLSNLAIQAVTVDCSSDGSLVQEDLEKKLQEPASALLLASPNFFGVVEEVKQITEKAHRSGSLVIACGNPLAYGLFASPAESGVDIAVGDTQPLGIPLQFGGPYAGYIACKQSLIRQMPGRIVGETVDGSGKRGFVLTLQAREQHIRREKATSNICTNQALCALATLITVLWYGPRGYRELALTNFQRCSYLKQLLGTLPGFSVENSTTFNEFVLRTPKPVDEVKEVFYLQQIDPGLALNRYDPQLTHHLLVNVTETKTKEQLDRFVQVAKGIKR